MDNKNNSSLPPQDFSPLYKIAAIILAAGLLTVCFAIVKIEMPILRFIVLSIGSTLSFLGITFIFVIRSAKKFTKQKHNYFLYDRKTKRDIDINSLTFSDIRIKIQKYMALFRRGKQLYVGDLFNSDIKIPPAIRTLFCYELLYEISEGGTGIEKAKRFLSFGNECAGVLYAHLASAGELQLAEKIRHYFNESATNDDTAEKFHRFLDANRQYLEASMVKFTKDHIDEF